MAWETKVSFSKDFPDVPLKKELVGGSLTRQLFEANNRLWNDCSPPQDRNRGTTDEELLWDPKDTERSIYRKPFGRPHQNMARTCFEWVHILLDHIENSWMISVKPFSSLYHSRNIWSACGQYVFGNSIWKVIKSSDWRCKNNVLMVVLISAIFRPSVRKPMCNLFKRATLTSWRPFRILANQ